MALIKNYIVRNGMAKINAGATQYGVPGTPFVSQGTSALTINTVRYVPLFVTYPVTITGWIFEVTTAPASNANVAVGIYAADTDLQPTGTPIYDSGSTAVASAFTGTKSASSLSVGLARGKYVVAINCDVTMTVRRIFTPGYTVNSTLGASALISHMTGTQTYGAFPNTGTKWDTTVLNTLGMGHSVFFQWSE